MYSFQSQMDFQMDLNFQMLNIWPLSIFVILNLVKIDIFIISWFQVGSHSVTHFFFYDFQQILQVIQVLLVIHVYMQEMQVMQALQVMQVMQVRKAAKKFFMKFSFLREAIV